MRVDIPSAYGPIIEQLIARGAFQSEAEVVAEGLRLVALRSQLHADIQAGLDDLDSGNGIAAEKVFAEARRRIGASENQSGK